MRSLDYEVNPWSKGSRSDFHNNSGQGVSSPLVRGGNSPVVPLIARRRRINDEGVGSRTLIFRRGRGQSPTVIPDRDSGMSFCDFEPWLGDV